MDMTDGLAKAKETAMKALELDDTLAEAHASLGLNLYDDLRYEEAQRELRRAIELNPNYASAHHWYSMCLLDMGRMKEAKEEIEKAHELDPLSPIITSNLGGMSIYSGRLDEAIAIADRLIENEPTFAFTYLWRGFCFMLKGMKERAYADSEAWHRLNRDENAYKLILAESDLWFGEREKASSIIEELIQKVGRPGIRESDIADCYAILGNRDEFFKWIDKAIRVKRIDAANLRYSPFYDKVREDPRFPEIFRKLGLPY
jgi:tetratricopeptide (TPR) repeat protein